eukprot:scaffold14328_cov143-Isochrysis_galbana.AAC.3
MQHRDPGCRHHRRAHSHQPRQRVDSPHGVQGGSAGHKRVAQDTQPTRPGGRCRRGWPRQRGRRSRRGACTAKRDSDRRQLNTADSLAQQADGEGVGESRLRVEEGGGLGHAGEIERHVPDVVAQRVYHRQAAAHQRDAVQRKLADSLEPQPHRRAAGEASVRRQQRQDHAHGAVIEPGHEEGLVVLSLDVLRHLGLADKRTDKQRQAAVAEEHARCVAWCITATQKRRHYRGCGVEAHRAAPAAAAASAGTAAAASSALPRKEASKQRPGRSWTGSRSLSLRVDFSRL